MSHKVHAAAAVQEEGASAVEYGLLVSLISGVIVFAVLALGVVTGEMFGDTCTEFRTAVSAAGNPTSSSC